MTRHIRFAGALALLLSSQACVESPKPAPVTSNSFETPPLTEPKEPVKSDVRSAIKRTVDKCKKEVQAALPDDKFDAYVEGSRVKYLATKEAEFKFEKCMSENGYPISAQ